MTDLSEFEAEILGPGPKCGMVRVLAALDDEQTAKLGEAMASDHITASAIAKVVTRWGVRLSDQTVLRHRSGKCSCQ